MKLRMLMLLVLTFTALALTSTQASAGTYLRGQSCTLNQSNNSCQFWFDFVAGQPYSCYTRFVAGGGGPYASHKTQILNMNGSTSGGSYSSAQTVYSNQSYCLWDQGGNFGAWAQGFQAGGGSTWRSYTLQLYSGTL